MVETKRIRWGCRSWDEFRTPLKPLGYVVAGLGFACLSVGIMPDALILLVYPKAFLIGFVAGPIGFALLGMVGIRFSIRDVYNKFEFTRRFL